MLLGMMSICTLRYWTLQVRGCVFVCVCAGCISKYAYICVYIYILRYYEPQVGVLLSWLCKGVSAYACTFFDRILLITWAAIKCRLDCNLSFIYFIVYFCFLYNTNFFSDFFWKEKKFEDDYLMVGTERCLLLLYVYVVCKFVRRDMYVCAYI